MAHVQVVNSTAGDIADDQAGVQSNSPIAVPPEAEVVDETKYVNCKLCTCLRSLFNDCQHAYVFTSVY